MKGTRTSLILVVVLMVMSLSSCLSMTSYKADAVFHQKTSAVEYNFTGYYFVDQVYRKSLGNTTYSFVPDSGKTFLQIGATVTNPEATEKHLPLSAVTIQYADGKAYSAFGYMTAEVKEGSMLYPASGYKYLADGASDVVNLPPNAKTMVLLLFSVPKGPLPAAIQLFDETKPLDNTKQ